MKKYIIWVLVSLISIATLAYLLIINETPTPIIEETIIASVDEEIIEEEPLEEVKVYDTDLYHSKLIDVARDNDVYGMQVVVFKDEEVLDSFNYGYSDIKTKEEVNDDTVFRIASTSKMISNILVMKLVDEGKISLDSNLKEVTGLNYNEDVKLYHVLTHTSGIKDNPIFNENLEKVYDIDYLLEISSKDEPGTKYTYTNFGAGTMAAIIEKLTGEYFMDYAQRELFDKLDLNGAYVCEYLDEGSTIAKMYMDNYVFDPVTWFYDYDFYRSFELGKQYRLAYGNMYINCTGLAKLGMLLAGDGSVNGEKILSEEALKEIRTIYDKAEGYPYMMGLNTDYSVTLVHGRNMYGHTGSAYNAISCLMYDPSDHTGVALLTNHSINHKNNLGYSDVIYDTVNLAYDNFFKD